MLQQNLVIGLPYGLQSKKAAEFVGIASSFECNVLILKNEKSIEAKSIMGVMSAAVRYREEITLVTDGSNEKNAMKVLVSFLCNENP